MRTRDTAQRDEAKTVRTAGKLCPHRIPEGSYCKRCAEERAARAAPAISSPGLTAAERRRLDDLEQTVEAGLETFVDVGVALAGIRDGRLYRQTHATFEGYLDERWGMSRSRAHRLIDAAKVAERMLPMGNIPNERQARELAPLADRPGEAHAALAEASTGGRPTAARVRAAVARRTGKQALQQRLVCFSEQEVALIREQAAAAEATVIVDLLDRKAGR